MHDCALEQKRGRGVFSAPRVEHTSHCAEISTKTTLQNQTKLRLRQVQAITPHYRSGGRRQGSCGFFWGALRHYLCTLCVCIHLIKSLLTDDWALSIVVILPRLVKVYNFFKRNRVSAVRTTF